MRADGLLVVPALSEGLEEDRPVTVELLVSPEDIDGTLVVLGSQVPTPSTCWRPCCAAKTRGRFSSATWAAWGWMALRQGRSHLGGSHMLDSE